MTQQNYTQYGYPAAGGYQQWHPAPQPAPSKALGIASMVVGIVALVLSFVPLIGLLSFLLGPTAIILGILALANKSGQAQGITGIITGSLGLVTVTIGTWLFGAALSSFEEEYPSTESEAREADSADNEAEEIEAAEDEAEEAAEVSAAQEDDGEEPEPAEAAGDEGSRANPLVVGETVSGDEWEVTVHSINRDAGGLIAAENRFNDPAPEGSSYALVDVSATYLGDDSEMAMLSTGIAYVTGGGETISAYEHTAIAPDAFNSSRELYNGGTERGNISIAIPDDDPDGTLRVRLGLFSTEDYFFEAE